MTLEFEFKPFPWNIRFQAGAFAQLKEGVESIGKQRPLVLSTPEQVGHAEQAVGHLGGLAVGVFSQARMHVPVETIESARQVASELKADCCVAVGGGSTTGLAKALAARAGLPYVSVPTTYAGSEMTNIWGRTEGGSKITERDLVVVPALTLYDPELTLDLPGFVAGPSGLNAIAQAVPSIMTLTPNPFVRSLAEGAIRAIASSLPTVIREPGNLEARATTLYGASMAGATLALGTMSLHHRLCHVFGGTFDTPHADTHAILLPHSVAFNAKAVPDGEARVADAVGSASAGRGLLDLLRAVSNKTSLADLGLSESDLDQATKVALETPVNNPAPCSPEAVRALLADAYRGELSSR